MAVKQVQSAARVLGVFEAVAGHQPIGVSALARLLADDKSGVQRALMTLADAGWIERAGGNGDWEVTSRVLVIVQRRSGLLERARASLEALRDETDETVILNVPDGGQILVLDVVESTQLVRTSPAIGFAVPAATSAAGHAILAYLPSSELAKYVGGHAGDRLSRRLGEVRRRGWGINSGDVTPGARAVGAPILDAERRAIASITISAPADRMPPQVQDVLGPLVVAAARRLSSH
jgi:IclR family transcriptional regulator, acetate operon repressor